MIETPYSVWCTTGMGCYAIPNDRPVHYVACRGCEEMKRSTMPFVSENLHLNIIEQDRLNNVSIQFYAQYDGVKAV